MATLLLTADFEERGFYFDIVRCKGKGFTEVSRCGLHRGKPIDVSMYVVVIVV